MYVFASTPQDADESDIYEGVLVSPRTGYASFGIKACSNVRVALSRGPYVSIASLRKPLKLDLSVILNIEKI